MKHTEFYKYCLAALRWCLTHVRYVIPWRWSWLHTRFFVVWWLYCLRKIFDCWCESLFWWQHCYRSV